MILQLLELVCLLRLAPLLSNSAGTLYSDVKIIGACGAGMGFKSILAAVVVALSFGVAGKASAVVIFSNVDSSMGAYTATHTVGMSFAPTQSGILDSFLLPLSS